MRNKRDFRHEKRFSLLFLINLALYIVAHLYKEKRPNIIFNAKNYEFGGFSLPDVIISDPLNDNVFLGPWSEAVFPIYSPPPMIPPTYHELLVKNNCSTILDELNDVIHQKVYRNIIENAVVMEHYSNIITSNFIYAPTNRYTIGYMDKIPKTYNPSKMKQIDDAIIFIHPFLVCYFHVLVEILPLVYALGPETVNKSVLLYTEPMLPYLLNDAFALLGFRPKNITPIYGQFFVRRLHITSPQQACLFYKMPLISMVKQIIRKLGHENLAPTKCIYIKRKNNRMITNDKKLFKQIYEVFPKDQWITHGIIRAGLNSQVARFRQAKLVLAMRGSGLVNCIWMHPKTVYFEIQEGRKCDPAFIALARVFGLKIFELTYHNFTSHKFVPANITLVMEMIHIIHRYLENMTF